MEIFFELLAKGSVLARWQTFLPIARDFIKQSFLKLLITMTDSFCFVNCLISGIVRLWMPPIRYPLIAGTDTLSTFTLIIFLISNASFELTTGSFSLSTSSALKSSAKENGIWMWWLRVGAFKASLIQCECPWKIFLYFRYEFVDQMVENVTEYTKNALDIREVHFLVPAGSSEQTASPWHSVNAVILFWVEIPFVIGNEKTDENLLFLILVFFSWVRLPVKLFSVETV